jgi:inhibitor of KinA
VLAATAALACAAIPGVRNFHPAYASVLVVLDPRAADFSALEQRVRRAVSAAAARPETPPRLIDVPVCYEREHAPDLDAVARLHGLSADDVVRMHSGAEYVVAFLGFMPGFPYLDGLPEALATPRLDVPRRTTPPGSVAIGGRQTGIYPFATPGGWRIVGRTPLRLFRAGRTPPSLLAPGDRVRFTPITAAAFAEKAS